MSDIVERLRAWVYTDSQYVTAREAADEIERLRDLRDEDGEVMSKLIDGYQRILRLLIDGPESMATDIVSDARVWLDGYACRVSTHSAKCHGWHDACLIARLVAECERLRELLSRTGKNLRRTCDEAAECRSRGAKCPERDHLTDAEREALHHVVGDVADISGPVEDTLRGLLERLGGGE